MSTLPTQPSAETSYWSFFSSSRYLHGVASILHAAQAVTVLALALWLDGRSPSASSTQTGKAEIFKGGRVQLYRAATRWLTSSTNSSFPPTVYTELLPYGELDIRYLIFAFFALSAMSHTFTLALSNDGRAGKLRYIEYSVSASVMVLAIASEAGIRDAYTLAAQFTLTWVTMLLGIVSELVHEAYAHDVPWLWLAPHVTAWATCLVAYAPILDVFLLNSSTPSTPPPPSTEYASPPDFVRVIVFLEFGMFMSFGFVQLYALSSKTANAAARGYQPPASASGEGSDQWRGLIHPHHLNVTHDPVSGDDEAIDDAAESAYIGLSLLAKTLLGWIVLSPLLASI